MVKQLIIPTMYSLLPLFIHFTTILAQNPAPAPVPPAPTNVIVPAPPAPTLSIAPAPPGPTEIISILQKAGRFTTLIRLLRTTQGAVHIDTELNLGNQGLTLFAPADGAFAKLKSGTLNSYTDQQKAELIHFHTLPSFFSIQQFQTATNPLSTEAGATSYGEFPLNVTTIGNSVNITTGYANASIVSTVYTGNQLAVYEVDKVLLPESFFVAHPPPPPTAAPAPAPTKHKKKIAQPSFSTTSDAIRLNLMHQMFHASFLVAVLAASWLF